MSKLGGLARLAVGIVVISTLWPIGLFGDEWMGMLGKIVGATIGFCVGGPVGAAAGFWIAEGGTNGDSFDVWIITYQ